MPETDNLCVRSGAVLRPWLLLAVLAVFASDATGETEFRSRTQYQKPDDTRNVLVLHSSHRGYGWTDSIMAGIESVMQGAPENIELWVEYLEASRLQSASFTRQLQRLYQSKYENLKLDVIITSDRKALQFLLENREQLAPGVPVVFSTVGNLGTRSAHGYPNLTGVSLSSLAACVSDRREDELKLEVMAKRGKSTECRSAAGRYRFVETRNLNAFLMWVERAPTRPEADRCVELALAIECLAQKRGRSRET